MAENSTVILPRCFGQFWAVSTAVWAWWEVSKRSLARRIVLVHRRSLSQSVRLFEVVNEESRDGKSKDARCRGWENTVAGVGWG